ncbi:MAG: hypothetical protein AAFX00_08370, partial [Pseudomonadota bacterium]
MNIRVLLAVLVAAPFLGLSGLLLSDWLIRSGPSMDEIFSEAPSSAADPAEKTAEPRQMPSVTTNSPAPVPKIVIENGAGSSRTTSERTTSNTTVDKAPTPSLPRVVEAPRTAQRRPEPAPDPAPEPAADIDMVDALRTLRADALLKRSKAEINLRKGQIAVHRTRVARALRPDTDTYFDQDHRAQATRTRTTCAAGVQDDCVRLGKLYEAGVGTWVDPHLALSFFVLACEAGSDAGCEAFSDSQIHEYGGHEGPFPDVPHFERRCAEGVGDHCWRLATLYRYGFREVAQDEALFADYMAIACDLGSGPACGELGDTARAMSAYQSACETGRADACLSFARALELNSEGDAGPKAAIDYFRQACDLQDRWACQELGNRYNVGRHVEQDRQTAKMLFEKACDLGSGTACFSAGTQWDPESFPDGDPARALEYYQQACRLVSGYDKACKAATRLAAGPIDPLSPAFDALFPEVIRAEIRARREDCGQGMATACTALGSMLRFYNPNAVVAAHAQEVLDRACSL